MYPLLLPLLLPLFTALSTAALNVSPIPLEIHIMSKCPDALFCFSQLIRPTLQSLPPSKVSFTMTFIGKVNPTNGGVTCIHGVGECLGNMVHLCGEKLYPWSSSSSSSSLSLISNSNTTTTFLPFSSCLLGGYRKLPNEDFIKHCASRGNVSFEDINACISSLDDDCGIGLLRKSCARSEGAGIRTSCTVRVKEKVVCVRDGGAWKECGKDDEMATVEGLKGFIERLYDEQGEGQEEGSEEEKLEL